MEDDKIDKLMKELIKECKKQDYEGVIIIHPGKGNPVKYGVAANFLEVLSLMCYFLYYLEKETGVSSVSIAIYLALASVATIIRPTEFKGDLNIFDAETLRKMGTAIKDILDSQVEDTIKQNPQVDAVSPILQ